MRPCAAAARTPKRRSTTSWNSTGSVAKVGLGKSGDANYDITLLAGTYDVAYQYTSGQTALPPMNLRLELGLAATSDLTKNFDLKTATVSGEVTLDGAAMPSETGTTLRGYLEFFERTSQSWIKVPLGTSGPATYSVTLFASTYDVDYQYATGQKVVPQMQIRLQHGCLNTACTASVSDISGTWQFIYDQPGWNVETMRLTQRGNSVSGTWSAGGLSGPLSNSSVHGSNAHIEYVYSCEYPRDATILSGCFMRGTGSMCGGQATFSALRIH